MFLHPCEAKLHWASEGDGSSGHHRCHSVKQIHWVWKSPFVTFVFMSIIVLNIPEFFTSSVNVLCKLRTSSLILSPTFPHLLSSRLNLLFIRQSRYTHETQSEDTFTKICQEENGAEEQRIRVKCYVLLLLLFYLSSTGNLNTELTSWISFPSSVWGRDAHCFWMASVSTWIFTPPFLK